MKLLIAAAPELQPSLLLDEGHTGERQAVLDAVNRVIEHEELRVPFSDEEMVAFKGIAYALEAGTCKVEAAGSPILIPPHESDLILDAMRLFMRIPEAERKNLSESEIESLDIVTQELNVVEHVFLDPGVQPEAVLTHQINAEEPLDAYQDEYEWLHDRNVNKAISGIVSLSVLDRADVVRNDNKLDQAKTKVEAVHQEGIIKGYEWAYAAKPSNPAPTPDALDTPTEQYVMSQIKDEIAQADLQHA